MTTMKRIKIKPTSLYWASFNRFEFRLPGQCVIDCSGPGPADDAVAAWKPSVEAQIAADAFQSGPTPDKIRAELKEYGAWDADELADDSENMERLIWIAASNIADADKPDHSKPRSTRKTTDAKPVDKINE